MAGLDTWRVNTDADRAVYLTFERRKVEIPPTGMFVCGFTIRVDSRGVLNQALRAGRGEGMCSFMTPQDAWSVTTDERGVSLRFDEMRYRRTWGDRVAAMKRGLWRQPVFLGKDEVPALAEALGAGRGQGTCSIGEGRRERDSSKR